MLSRKYVHRETYASTPPRYRNSDSGWWLTLAILLALATVVTAMFGA